MRAFLRNLGLGRYENDQFTCSRNGCSGVSKSAQAAFQNFQALLNQASGMSLPQSGTITQSHADALTKVALGYPKQFGTFQPPYTTADVAELAVELASSLQAVIKIKSGASSPSSMSTEPRYPTVIVSSDPGKIPSPPIPEPAMTAFPTPDIVQTVGPSSLPTPTATQPIFMPDDSLYNVHRKRVIIGGLAIASLAIIGATVAYRRSKRKLAA